jgi:hypothetical protein
MRYLAGFGLALALVVFPISVNAQGAEGASKQASAASFVHGGGLLPPQLMLPASHFYYVYPGCPFGERGGKCAEPTAPSAQTPLDRQRASVRRARSGLIGSSVVLAAGGGIIAGTIVATRNYSCEGDFFCLNSNRIAGVTIGSLVVLGGIIGMGISGGRWSARKAELRKLQETNNRHPRRVRWDLHASSFVF